MKRILVFISLLLPIVASAQFTTNSTMVLLQTNECVNIQKIKYFTDVKSIALSKDSLSGIYSFYILKEGASNVWRITIDYPISVINDFEIIDDMLYFCGADNGYGVIGQLSLSNITNINIISLPFLKEASKIKLRNISGVTHVFGIGMSYTLPVNLNNYIFDAFSNGTNFICSAYSCFPNEDVELFTDIDLTNQYIAVVGYHKSSTRLMVWKRGCNNNTNTFDPFKSTRSFIDYVVDNKFLIKHTTNDNVAITYLQEDNSNNSFLHVNTMDIDSFTLISSIMFQSNPYSLKAIDYVAPLNRLLVLQSDQHMFNTISYCTLSSLTYQPIPRAVISGIYLTDLNLYRDSSYTAVGTNTNNNLILFNKTHYDYSETCNTFDEVKNISITTTFKQHIDLHYHPFVLSSQHYNITLYEEPIKILCK